MNTFQLLKSGTSFKKDKIAPDAKFKKSEELKQKQAAEENGGQKEDPRDYLNYESDKEIPDITKQIKKLKKQLKATTGEKPKKIQKIEEQYKHLVNKKKEVMNQLRKKYRIKVEGDSVPDLIDSFAKLTKKYKLTESFNHKLAENHFKKPTPVQMQAIPVLFNKRSAIVLAETGSGKSLAFIAPMLHLLKNGDGLKAIVVSPTRELTIQLYKEFLMFSQIGSHSQSPRVKFLRKTLFPKNEEQYNQLIQSTEILISTPLKLAELCQKHPLNNLEFLVVDEADKMFELGFLEQIDTILSQQNNQQKMCKFLFSATMQPGIEDLVRTIMDDPIKIQIGIKNASNQLIDQKIQYVGDEQGKLMTLRQLFQAGFEPPMLIFVQSKQRAKELFHELIYEGLNANVIHADKKKHERDEIIKQFRLGKIWVLIATDLMARGIDFKGVNMVINYDFPQSIVSYIHRIGRTGRAGKAGKAITYFTDDDSEFLRNIANLLKKSGLDVPDWMLTMKPATSKRWKEIEKKPIQRRTISTEIEKNTNKRFQKQILKEGKRLSKLAQKFPQNINPVDEDGNEINEGKWQKDDHDEDEAGQEVWEDDEKLGSDEEWGSGDEEINSDEC
ncbi:probable atp-dependent rna helicase ddx52-like [Stylonychia lemnae]|uniref:RNA helicase n=1 Tax=Stylonychia lemnae TaxID=5949 RepID=A0A078BCR6_STYLE|nr:probable atp-dependent rna helicase ddx52-like [Stylonychia lemnae]|eukprot:CDW91012.1 probable atp-dependent rna helicase ddx52-like [Stylonychia lemnae]